MTFDNIQTSLFGARAPRRLPTSEDVMKRLLMLVVLMTLVLSVQVLAQVPRTVLGEHLTATW